MSPDGRLHYRTRNDAWTAAGQIQQDIRAQVLRQNPSAPDWEREELEMELLGKAGFSTEECEQGGYYVYAPASSVDEIVEHAAALFVTTQAAEFYKREVLEPEVQQTHWALIPDLLKDPIRAGIKAVLDHYGIVA